MNVKIYWENGLQSAYSHGSSIELVRNKVLFENAFMPPSLEVKRWFSQTNFQGMRSQPKLPLLYRGQTYRLTLVGRVEPASSVYIRVDFYDRHYQEAGFEILKGDQTTFTYPAEAHTYSVALINAGCHLLEFDYLYLTKVEESEPSEELEVDVLLYPQDSCRLTILFLESLEDMVEKKTVLREIAMKQGNVVIVANGKDGYSLLAEQNRQFISNWANEAEFDTICLIGCGELSNIAALYYQNFLSGSKAFISQAIPDAHHCQTLLEDAQLSIDTFEQILTGLERASIYSHIDKKELELIRTHIHPLEQFVSVLR